MVTVETLHGAHIVLPKVLTYVPVTDVITIEKTNDFFRLLYDVKGRFILHKITKEEASYKLLKVRKVGLGPKAIPYLTTHDGRTIRYPDPLIKVHDTVRYDLVNHKIVDFVKFETGNLCMVTGGHNLGRVGVITSRERHPGSFDIVHVRDSLGHSFATRYAHVLTLTSPSYFSVMKKAYT